MSISEGTVEEDKPVPQRLKVNNEGLLDPSVLIRREGYMYKKGGAVKARGGFRNWKKRWFVLEHVDFLGNDGFELVYYDSPGGKQKGRVGLSEIELYCETKSTHKKVKYEFQILLQNGGILQLSCDDSQEREEWIETLNMVIAYLRKIVTASSMTLDGYDPMCEDDEESFNIGEEIAKNCQAFGPALFGSVAGEDAQFVMQIYDLQGNQVVKGGMPVTATISNDDSLYYLLIQDNEDGSYQAHYTLAFEGRYKLSVMLNDEHHIMGSPFDIQILPARTIASFSTAEGEMLTHIRSKETSSFTIISKDCFSNRKHRGGDPYEVGVMGPAQLVSLTDNADGSYTCTIEANSAHDVTYVASSSLLLSVTLHGKHISGSPFKPIILESLAPSIVSSDRQQHLSGSAFNQPLSDSRSSSFAASGAVSVADLNSTSRSNAGLSSSSNLGTSNARSQQQLLHGTRSTPVSSPLSAQQLSAASPEQTGGAMTRLEKARMNALARSTHLQAGQFSGVAAEPSLRPPLVVPRQATTVTPFGGLSAPAVATTQSPPPVVAAAASGSSANNRLSQLAARSAHNLQQKKLQQQQLLQAVDMTDSSLVCGVSDAMHYYAYSFLIFIVLSMMSRVPFSASPTPLVTIN
jgi:hypothetical protein